MTVLSDWEIRAHCEATQMVWPFRPDLLNPASLDVVLGDVLMVEMPGQKELEPYSISSATAENPYWLTPRQFVLAQTREVFNIPNRVAAQFVLKSSRAREGYNNMLAGWADPGFNNSVLTLELQNCRKHVDLPLYPNLKIGQMVFFNMSNTPIHSYEVTGRYNGDVSTTGSKG
tara:strand:- start:412 stop:930 length:519 start_codon:yes stop_codon:yes gene_type:complete